MIATLRHRPGEKVQERYETLSELGSGAFGTVYKCRDLELNIYVAVKELHVLNDPQTPGDERAFALEQFRNEALHLSNLRHPHIVSGHYEPHAGSWMACPVCGFTFRGTQHCPQHNTALLPIKQRHYLVMEYLDGPDVGEACGAFGGVMPVAQAVGWMRQVAEALAMIHGRGWIHRDVKPENVRLRMHGTQLENADAVLLDFGIASESGVMGEYSTRAHRHTQGGGTLGYAPDSPQERRHPDPRSDIHALGMTFYRLISGRDPLEPAELAQMRAYAPRAFNPRLSPALEDLIVRSIAPDATKRPADGREWLRSLDAAEGLPTQAGYKNGAATLAITPLGFSSGRAATTADDAIRLLDAHPGDAKRLLYSGHLADWFEEAGKPQWAVRAREIQREFPDYREQGVEAMLQFTGLVAPPDCAAYPRALEFGVLRKGEKKQAELRLHNGGRGWLFGALKGEPCLHAPEAFEGNDARVPIVLDARRVVRGEARGELLIDSSAGELRVPWRATVKGDDYATTIAVVLWAALGMLCAQLLRTIPMAGQPEGWRWVSDNVPPAMPSVGPLFGLILWGTLLLVSIGEATRRKSCGTLFLGLSGALLAGVVSMFAGNELLAGGDRILQPLVGWASQNWAAGGWMFAGGLLGAAYGTLRRAADLLGVRGMQIAAGWILTLALWLGVVLAALALVPPFRN